MKTNVVAYEASDKLRRVTGYSQQLRDALIIRAELS